MTTLERAARAAGEVAATMDSDVRHLLSERALIDVARAVLMAVKDPDSEIVEEGLKEWSNLRDMFDAMINAILAEGE